MRRFLPAAVTCLLSLVPGCATIEKYAELPNVEFHLDGTEHARLAGIDIDHIDRVEQIPPLDFLRIADAARRGNLPLRFDLLVGADNASTYTYDLRLEKLEWTLLLEDRDTVSGVLERNLVISPTGTTAISVPVELDLMRFFEDGASDLARLALRVAGVGDETANVKLRARPTLRTPLGTYRFPSEITIASKNV